MTLMRDQLPHKGLEAWKWSDLRAAIGASEPDGFEAAMPARLDGPTLMSSDVVPVAPEEALGQIAAEHADGITSVVVPEGTSFDKPLELRDLSTGHARIRIEVGAGASLDVVEYHEGEAGFANLDLTYVVKEGGALRRTVLSDDGETMIRHVRAHVTLWDNATFRQTALSFGSKFSRLETRLACMGAVDAELSGAYLLNGSRHCDMTHYTDLSAPGSRIRDAVAGVVTDKARGVFQGKFHVRRPAQETDAEMRHDALMLSDFAKVNAKPELEIYADDVECAHGNTVGQLDEQALFYMRQRGIPLAEARALLLEAFVVARLGDDDAMAERVQAWLLQTAS